MFIYPRKVIGDQLRNGLLGVIYHGSKNGWITEKLFVTWLDHLQKNVKSSEDNPVLLVLDSHGSHITLQPFKFYKEHSNIVVSLPPRTSNKTQPLDLSFFSLKNALSPEYSLYLSTSEFERITEYEIAELVDKAVLHVATMNKAISGFRGAGIYILNPFRFNENDFAAPNLHEYLQARLNIF